MHLVNLKLTNFKTYADLDADFCGNVNCLVGNNGVGKTNLLDAVYYLSFSKSFFNATDSQNIKAGEVFFAVHGRYAMSEGEALVSCIQRQGQTKQMRWNKKAYKRLGEHIGKIPLVIISPNDQSIIQGGSDGRRKFIDGVISQTDRGYLEHLLQYQKALDQRNRLLKQMYEDRAWEEASLQVWDDQLVRHGEEIYAGRAAFMEAFMPLFDYYHSWITDGSERAVMQYERNREGGLRQQLLAARRDDRYAQYTTAGPHKDDIEMQTGGMSVKRYGSQGQQKTFVLSLKLAQFEYIYQKSGIKPILLLDDIFDKLDMPRVRQLLHLVGSDRFGQVFLTDTQPGRVERIFDEMPKVEHRIFEVKRGEINVIG